MDGDEKEQKQDRNERMQEDYLTSAEIHSRSRVFFFQSFISALLVLFQLHP